MVSSLLDEGVMNVYVLFHMLWKERLLLGLKTVTVHVTKVLISGVEPERSGGRHEPAAFLLYWQQHPTWQQHPDAR